MTQPPTTAPPTPPATSKRTQKSPGAALLLTLLFVAFIAFPRVRENEHLVQTFVGVGAFLFVWGAILWIASRRSRRTFDTETVPAVRSHYVQGSVQTALYVYWGWYWRDVYAQWPLFVSQLLFLYIFDALLAWSRGRTWRLGWGMLPIMLSTNVFIWFKDDWYVFQFVMIASSVLAKEFIRWRKDGRSAHVFNPSSFGLALFSVILIATGTTDHTWAVPIADSLARVPQIFVYVFCLGLIVQYLFAVTLMTLTAAATICLLNVAFTQITGTYFFVFWNLSAPVFIGLHLLMTDPATSPRSHTGRILFGAMYGVMTFALYGVLAHFELPTVYDKLLPIPILNLSVRFLERFTRSGRVGTLERWESSFPPRRTNLVYMSVWIALFASWIATGYIQAPHEGNTLEFWKRAYAEHRPYSGTGYLLVARAQAREGSAEALNELGKITFEGVLVDQHLDTVDRLDKAARLFSQASKLGSVAGSANLAAQFLSVDRAPLSKPVTLAFDQLENACIAGADATFYALIGRAYETGHGRPLDRVRAHDFYKEGCTRGDPNACAGSERTSVQKVADPPPVK